MPLPCLEFLFLGFTLRNSPWVAGAPWGAGYRWLGLSLLVWVRLCGYQRLSLTPPRAPHCPRIMPSLVHHSLAHLQTSALAVPVLQDSACLSSASWDLAQMPLLGRSLLDHPRISVTTRHRIISPDSFICFYSEHLKSSLCH
jgi:hypothetical protein